MKHHSKQIECDWGEPEAFTLVPESALDGDRVTAEAKQRDTDRQMAEEKQTTLL